jgi:hypothetical protein
LMLSVTVIVTVCVSVTVADLAGIMMKQ